MEVNCESMAVIGATLANGGTCPTTLDSIIKPEHCRDVLSLLHSCGFYEYSGQFAFKVSQCSKLKFLLVDWQFWSRICRKLEGSDISLWHHYESWLSLPLLQILGQIWSMWGVQPEYIISNKSCIFWSAMITTYTYVNSTMPVPRTSMNSVFKIILSHWGDGDCWIRFLWHSPFEVKARFIELQKI